MGLDVPLGKSGGANRSAGSSSRTGSRRPDKTLPISSLPSGPLIEAGWAVVLVPYAVLVLIPTAGSGALAVDFRDPFLEEGVAGMSLSERAGDAPLLLAALLVARVERLVDILAISVRADYTMVQEYRWRSGMLLSAGDQELV